jgi:hypothetical protein
MNNELVPQPSWWKRNWKWVVPVGGCFTLIIVAVIAIASIFYGVTNAIEDSQPHEFALEKINSDEDLVNALGTPIEKDGMVSGNWNYVNGKKSAKMTIPISGPKGSGMLFVEATGEDEDWTYHVIRVEIEDSETFDIIEEPELEQF